MQSERAPIVLNMTDYPALRDKKALRLLRLQPDRYKLVIRRFDPQTGKPSDPEELNLNRAGARELAKGLEQENERLLALVESNKTAIKHLTGTLIADMDAIDQAEQSAGDL